MKNGLTLLEENYCQLVVTGEPSRTAYAKVWNLPPDGDARHVKRLDARAGRLARRADIVLRMEEIRRELRQRDREKWERRGDEIAETIYGAIMSAAGAGKTAILDKCALHGVEVLAKMKGLNAPDTTVVKDGGASDDCTPRALRDMTDDELAAALEASLPAARRAQALEAEAVEAEAVEA